MAEKRKNNNYICLSIAVFLVVIVVCGTSIWIIYSSFTNWSDRGTFGDSFGAINALFSGFAFAGLIITLVMQRDELRMQREELEQTREEMERQSKEFKEQNKTMKLQRFENTFFNMLSLHETITKNLHYVSNDGADYFECDGRDVFDKFYNHKVFDFESPKIYGIKNYMRLNESVDSYANITDISVFDHYFRHLYRILKMIKETSLLSDERERYEYASILRSQLSECELLILFYNCLLPSHQQFKALIEEFAMFNNLRAENLGKQEHRSLYNVGAYSRSKILNN